jgi:hypothetical protein
MLSQVGDDLRMCNARVNSLLVLATMSIVGCETSESRHAAAERNNKKAAEELRHLCTLPDQQREAEIARLQEKYHVTIVCPPQPP